jgi:hypothetical protein
MFKSAAWLEEMRRNHAIPGLVGDDLHLIDNDEHTDTILALVLTGPWPARGGGRERLLCCLQPYKETKKDELYFPESQLTLNIASLHGESLAIISRPHLLFSLQSSLDGAVRTTVLLYGEDSVLRNIHRTYIGGLCEPQCTPLTISEVRDVCSILLHDGRGKLRYHRFQRPGCPAVREITASYEGRALGPWRFERRGDVL